MMQMTGLRVSVISCLLMRMSEARQCQDSSDCPPQSPHCSDWGWCQWTDQYGTAGPTNNEEEPGSCKRDEDCTPRFPVCSNLGFCTVKDYFEKSGIKRVNTKPQSGEDRRKFPAKNDIQSLNNVRKSLRRSSTVDREQNRNNPSEQRQKLQTPFPPPITPQNEQQQSSKRNSFVSEPRSTGPPVPGIIQDSELSNVADLASIVTGGNTRLTASDYYDRKSTDYYENYDYNYYTEFEVLRKDKQLEGMDKSVQHKIHGQFRGTQDNGRTHDQRRGHVSATSATRTRTINSDPFIYEEYEDDSDGSASTGGCLNDCVTDCVAIQQLTAYRDCVGFCGKTCKD